MDTKELVIKIKLEERMRSRRRAMEFRLYARLSLIALAAMVTARLILLSIDYMQSRAGAVGGEICITIYVVIFVIAGWRLKSWAAKERRRRR